MTGDLVVFQVLTQRKFDHRQPAALLRFGQVLTEPGTDP
jgi:hypothetical protein